MISLETLFGPEWANVRTANIDGVEMFMAHDICKILKLSNVTIALKGVKSVNVSPNNRTKEFIEEWNNHRKIHLITLDGVFQLILNSKSTVCRRIKEYFATNVLAESMDLIRYRTGRNVSMHIEINS